MPYHVLNPFIIQSIDDFLAQEIWIKKNNVKKVIVAKGPRGFHVGELRIVSLHSYKLSRKE